MNTQQIEFTKKSTRFRIYRTLSLAAIILLTASGCATQQTTAGFLKNQKYQKISIQLECREGSVEYCIVGSSSALGNSPNYRSCSCVSLETFQLTTFDDQPSGRRR